MFSNHISDTIRACEGMVMRYVDQHPKIKDAPYGALALQRLKAPARESLNHPEHTEELKAAVLAAVNSGLSIPDAASNHHLSPCTVRRWARAAGCTVRRLRMHRIPDTLRAAIIVRIDSGVIPAQVAIEVGLSASTICRVSRAAGYRFTRGRNARCIARPASSTNHSIAA